MAAPAAEKCPRCNEDVIAGKTFCPNCGQAIAQSGQKAAIDSYIAARVEQELKAQTKDEESVVREVAFKAENEAISRLKRYWWIVVAYGGLVGAVITFAGFATLESAKTTIVSEAEGRIEPTVSDAEKRVNSAKDSIAQIEKVAPTLRQSLNEIAKTADEQRRRLDGQNGEINQKIASFQASAAKTDQLASGFEAKAVDASKRLDEMARRYDTSLQQVSKAVVHTALSQAFPGLDDRQYFVIGPVRFDVTEKKPGEQWTNVWITHNAEVAHVIGQKQLEEMGLELQTAGVTLFPGVISFGGRGGGLIEKAGPGSYEESSVMYFRRSSRLPAEKITSIVSKYIKLASGSPVLVESGEGRPMRGGVDLIRQNGKLDAQIFISAPFPQ